MKANRDEPIKTAVEAYFESQGSPTGVTLETFFNAAKKRLYTQAMTDITDRLVNVDRNALVSRMSTAAAVLKEHMPHYFWTGFYFCGRDVMTVGPYQGPPACVNIPYSGVCGESAIEKKTIIVPNVHERPGHVSCDDRSNSEMVVPLLSKDGSIRAVFDVDSAYLDAFSDVDQRNAESIMLRVMGRGSS